MTVRNGEAHLEACLQSICRQSLTDWELICIDNQSTDGTSKILEKFSNTDKRIKIIYNSDSPTVPTALHLALDHARGKLVTRMDGDDIMPEHKLQYLSDLIEDEKVVATGLVKYFPEDVVQDGYRRYEKWLNDNMLSGNPFGEIYKECILPSPNWMMHKNTLVKIGGIPEGVIPEDYDLAFRCYEHGLHIVAKNEITHFWREHEFRHSRKDPDYWNNNYLALKLTYFIRLEHREGIPLFVWGAGKKGKNVVKLFIALGIRPQWITDNPEKIGKDIYGIQLAATSSIDDEKANVIIAVSSPAELEEIQSSSIVNRDGIKPYFFY